MTRTSWCGQVAAPKASLSLAWSRRLDAKPSAPPITKAGRRAILGAPFAQCRRERRAVQRCSALVEDDDDGALGNHIGDGDRFLDAAALGVGGAALANFDDLDVAQAERASDLFRTLAIFGGEFALRPLLEAADRGNDDAHEQPPARS